MLPVNPFRGDFPILARRINGHPLAYLDNAATTHKPRAVIQALTDFYERSNANVHRGVHTLAEEATQAYEDARAKLAAFLGAGAPSNLVFTRGTTDALNLVAWGWARSRLRPGDAIVATEAEHHSNLVPWQMVAKHTGATLRLARLRPDGRLDMDHFESLLDPRARIVAIAHTSNVLGTVHPLPEITARARAAGAIVVVDAAQAAGRAPLDVRALDCDFLALSAHKMYGPMGIGALYGKAERLEEIEPVQGGGGMIERVNEQGAEWAALPARLEAGTPNVAGAHAFGAAVDYLAARRGQAAPLETRLIAYALERLLDVPGLALHGPRETHGRAGVFSFNLPGRHPHDVAEVLDGFGVAVRAGHHCCQPLMKRLNTVATVRASLALYSGADDVDRLADGLRQVSTVLG